MYLLLQPAQLYKRNIIIRAGREKASTLTHLETICYSNLNMEDLFCNEDDEANEIWKLMAEGIKTRGLPRQEKWTKANTKMREYIKKHQHFCAETRLDNLECLDKIRDLRREKDEVLTLLSEKETQLNDAQQRVQTLEQLAQDLKETVAEYDDLEYRAEAFDEEFDDNDKMQGPSAEIMDAALKTKNGC